MPLSPGDKLGPYEILAPIGAGGMGEVYRARDPRLDRDVAIKVSPEQIHRALRARGPRHRRAESSQHLHAVRRRPELPGDGVGRGATLADRKGPLPLDEALRIARQIADALEAAHEKGIIHRDLKPANIKIKPDGAVKVLDFGLAKIVRSGIEPTRGFAHLTMAHDAAGMILGTAAYMAPEQARGKEVDKRADIWAFGVVLYEMLTGKRLFQGEDRDRDAGGGGEGAAGSRRRVSAEVRRLLKQLSGERSEEAAARHRRLHRLSRPTPGGASRQTVESSTLDRGGRGERRGAGAGRLALFPATAASGGDALPDSGAARQHPSVRHARSVARWTHAGIYRAGARWGRAHSCALPRIPTESRALSGTEKWGPSVLASRRAIPGVRRQRRAPNASISPGVPRSLAKVNAPWHGSWSQTGVIVYQQGGLTEEISAKGEFPDQVVKLDPAKAEAGSDFPCFLSDGKRFLTLVSHPDSSRDIDLATLGSMERRLVLAGVISAPIPASAPNGRVYLLYLAGRLLNGAGVR